MNRLRAEITGIESGDHISLVALRAHGDDFSCVVIETPETAPYLQIGREVEILFKETEVSIAKNFAGEISLRNRIPATIKAVDKGVVLARVVLDYKGQEIISIITTRSATRLNLQPGDRVTGLVKANEVSILG